MEIWQVELLDAYSANGMGKLKKLVRPIIRKFGGISEEDYDEFYSVANTTLWHAVEDFDESLGVPFEGFLALRCRNKLCSKMTSINRKKRIPPSEVDYLDAPIGGDEEFTLGMKLQDKLEFEKEVLDSIDGSNADKYMATLSYIEQKIVDLLVENYKSTEIQSLLHISPKEYYDHMSIIREYEKVSILF